MQPSQTQSFRIPPADTLAPAPGTAAVWKYRAIYLDGDDVFGQWSDTASLAVNG